MQRTSSTGGRNIFWPLLIVALGGVLIALALDVFPATVADLIRRAWPALLVFVGLTVLLEQIRPLRRFAPLIALILTAGGVAFTVTIAYSTRAEIPRAENVVRFEQVLDDSVERLHVIVRGQQTSVEISPVVPDQQTLLNAEFVGSTESVVTPEFSVNEEGVASFVFEETRPNDIPSLEAIGRGQMRIELPLGVPIALDFTTENGTVSLNLLGLEITRLDVVMQQGDLLLGLPRSALERRAEVFVGRGDVTVFVPEDVGLQVTSNATPQFSGGNYLFDPASGAYLSRRFDDLETKIELNLTAGGRIQLQ